jgi:hypothetical protein
MKTKFVSFKLNVFNVQQYVKTAENKTFVSIRFSGDTYREPYVEPTHMVIGRANEIAPK